MTDPSLRRPADHVHRTRTSATTASARPAMESDRIHAARGDHARRDQPRGRARRRARLAGLAARLRRPGHHRRRHARARPPHPRRGRDARRGLPGARCARPRRGARRRRAEHGRPRPRPRGDAGASRSCSTADGDGPADRRASTPASSARSSATSRARRDARAVPVHDRRATSCSPATPTAFFLVQRPRRPGGARLRRRDRPRRSSARSPCSASASATSCSAAPSAWRRTSCPFGHRGANHPVKDLTTGRIEITRQNHGFAVGPRRALGRAGASPTSAPPS